MDSTQLRARRAWQLLSADPHMTRRSLGKHLGCGMSQVYRALSDLQALGYIRQGVPGGDRVTVVVVPFVQGSTSIVNGKLVHDATAPRKGRMW